MNLVICDLLYAAAAWNEKTDEVLFVDFFDIAKYHRKEQAGCQTVLMTISIPIFTTQLEKAREATDLANIRAAYAQAMVAALDSTTGTGSATTVAMTQTGTGWQYETDSIIGDYSTAAAATKKLPAVLKTDAKNTLAITVAADGTVTIEPTVQFLLIMTFARQTDGSE